ncbi:hypothetical protein [Moellerella wisconsensis]|uniref:hypothetical protein n=1 Tax=Moellerella wisconsensis TaxID=158849 RepID=UPI00240F6253|nr:hypothetical protein [Moellerella wisconsensis]
MTFLGMQITGQQAEFMQHALGIHENNRVSNRNYFLASGRDVEIWTALVDVGYATGQLAPSWVGGGTLFTVTESGIAIALAMLPKPKKVKRNNHYPQYLNADCGDTFSEFLLGRRAPLVEHRTNGERYEYRMYREKYCEYYSYLGRDVEGDWSPTQKAAKASYKLALKSAQEKRKQNRSVHDTAQIH